MTRFGTCLLAILFGGLLTFSYAPFSIWPLCIVGLIGFFYLLIHTNHAFKLGLCFGAGWFGAGMSWVHVSIADFGELPLIASLGLMGLLCGYLALFPALFSWLLKRYIGTISWPVAALFLWIVLEWLRSWLFTGFPWLSIGYSQIDSPISGWMPVIGEVGVSGLLILISSSVAVGIIKKQWLLPSLLTAIVFLSGWTLDQINWTQIQSSPVNIAMVQGNIRQELRWAPEQDLPTMRKYRNMSADHWQNDVVIWPEAAIPKLEPTATQYLFELDRIAAESKTGFITGIVNYNFETEHAFNSLIALGRKDSEDVDGHYRYAHSNRYDKHHLLPFGEFIPLEEFLRGLAPIFDLPMSSFTRGDFEQSNLIVNGFHFAPALCFEIAFPRQVAANIREQTDFIITVSNDAWFGASHGPAQHMEIARVRAKEFAKPVLRATNNGITAFVDHKGDIQSRLPQFEAGVLSDQLYPTRGFTPYNKWGDWPIFIISLFAFAATLIGQKKK